MQFPRIHMNGTPAERLLEQYSEAIFAINDALAALGRIDVNGRDYYPMGDAAITAATKEHRARYEALMTVWKELSAIAENIDEQSAKRAA